MVLDQKETMIIPKFLGTLSWLNRLLKDYLVNENLLINLRSNQATENNTIRIAYSLSK